MIPWHKESPSPLDGQGTHSKNRGYTLDICELYLVKATSKDLHIRDPAHICKKASLEDVTNVPSAGSGANNTADRGDDLESLHLRGEARFLLWRKRKPDRRDLEGGRGGCKRVPLRRGGRTLHQSPKPKAGGIW